jgi:hypothetical protein
MVLNAFCLPSSTFANIRHLTFCAGFSTSKNMLLEVSSFLTKNKRPGVLMAENSRAAWIAYCLQFELKEVFNPFMLIFVEFEGSESAPVFLAP